MFLCFFSEVYVNIWFELCVVVWFGDGGTDNKTGG